MGTILQENDARFNLRLPQKLLDQMKAMSYIWMLGGDMSKVARMMISETMAATIAKLSDEKKAEFDQIFANIRAAHKLEVAPPDVAEPQSIEGENYERTDEFDDTESVTDTEAEELSI